VKLYEYAVVLDEKRDKDDEVTDDSRIVVPITAVVARDDAQAQLLAARSAEAREEALQIAAMACRYIYDLCDKEHYGV
jgi:hypothetical protein